MPLKYEIDVESILSQCKEFRNEIVADMEKSVQNLMTLTKAKIATEAAAELSSATSQIYMGALSDPEEIAPGVWVVSLDEKALWIEEGIPQNKDMKPDLLKGRKYRVIAFRYDKSESQNTPLTQGLIMEINQKLKKEKISISKIEKDEHGSPRVGKLHEFDLSGPGKIMSWKKRRQEETHPLTRLSIYQRKDEAGKIKRDVMVFRTVSSGPASSGKWIHPGYEAKRFMDRAMEWAVRQWEQQVLPEILSKYGTR